MRVLATSFALVLCGCTTSLTTNPVPKGVKGIAGIPYTLPALQYQLSVTRTLTGCKQVVDEKKKGIKLELDFGVKVDASPVYVEGETFVADYRTLSSGSKVTSIKIESYDNHTIKTINAEADDKGPEIVAGVAKAGFAVARLALGLPAAPKDIGGGTPTTLECPPEVAANERIVEAIKEKTKALEKLNKALEPLIVAALIDTLTDADKEIISKLRGEMRDVSTALAAWQAKSNALTAKLAFSEKIDVNFSSGKADLAIAFPSGDPTVAALQDKWLRQLFGTSLSDDQIGHIATQMKSLVATFRTIGGLDVTGDLCTDAGVGACLATKPEWPKSSDAKSAHALPGFVYRQPVKGRLRICRDVTAEDCAAGTTQPIVEAYAWAPQMGRLVILPFRNGFGANNQLQAQFRADGSLDWASYSEKRAVGVAASESVNAVLGQGLALSSAIQTKQQADEAAATAKKQAAVAAELTGIQHQISLAKGQKELLDAQAALDPANTAIVQQQALLDARLAQLTAQAKIEELESKLTK